MVDKYEWKRAEIFFSTFLLKKLSLGTLPTVTEMEKNNFDQTNFET